MMFPSNGLKTDFNLVVWARLVYIIGLLPVLLWFYITTKATITTFVSIN